MKKDSNIPDTQHSERVRRLLGQEPPRAIRWATAAVIAFFVILAALIYTTGIADTIVR